MADVFISYAREDRERAARLARALEGRGRSVWWDRKLVAGQSFDQAIERELEQAASVVVLWSANSVDKAWVRNEARRAAARGVLVPAMIDVVDLPLEFSDRQAADLVGWEGNAEHAGFQVLCEGIAAATGTAPAAIPSPPVTPRTDDRRRWIWAAAAAAAVALTVVAYLYIPSPVPQPEPAQPTPSARPAPVRESPRADGLLRSEMLRSLGAAQRAAVEKLIARGPGALADVDRNLHDIERAAEGFPNDADFQALLGYARKDAYQSTRGLLAEERRNEYLALARSAFERSLQLDPDSAAARNGMGNVLFFECRFDEAIAWYDKALAVAAPDYRSIIEGDRRGAVAARARKLTCPLPV